MMDRACDCDQSGRTTIVVDEFTRRCLTSSWRGGVLSSSFLSLSFYGYLDLTRERKSS
jgi:hypothetical protein